MQKLIKKSFLRNFYFITLHFCLHIWVKVFTKAVDVFLTFLACVIYKCTSPITRFWATIFLYKKYIYTILFYPFSVHKRYFMIIPYSISQYIYIYILTYKLNLLMFSFLTCYNNYFVVICSVILFVTIVTFSTTIFKSTDIVSFVSFRQLKLVLWS